MLPVSIDVYVVKIDHVISRETNISGSLFTKCCILYLLLRSNSAPFPVTLNIPTFCFPDMDIVEPVKKMKTETYCFVFTDLQAQVFKTPSLSFIVNFNKFERK